MTVEKGHATYEQLEEPSIPLFKDFYFFNLTNAEEFHKLKGGSKPVLKEIGPYSYRYIYFLNSKGGKLDQWFKLLVW